MRLVEYCTTAPNTAMAIYRIKYGWRIPKGWQPQRSFDFLLDSEPKFTPPADAFEVFDPKPEDIQKIASLLDISSKQAEHLNAVPRFGPPLRIWICGD